MGAEQHTDPYVCDDCDETFDVELFACQHANRMDHTVRYWGGIADD
jgi:hypothetical protein